MSTAPTGALVVLAGGALLLAPSRSRLLTRPPGFSAVGRTGVAERLRGALERRSASTRDRLALAGSNTSVARHLLEKLLAAVVAPVVPLLPLAALEQRTPPLWLVPPLALAGFLLPDLALRRALIRRRARILLDLPDALSLLALALAAGRSLQQALALAARETRGPLGEDLAAALNLARRDPSLDVRGGLVRVARRSSEPTFTRAAELLAAKESPYVEFLRTQAAQARVDQQRALDEAAERAQLAMQAPLAPLLATLVLLVAYGFLHQLGQTI